MPRTFMFVVAYAAVGGGETLVIRRTRWLTARGHHVVVMCPAGPAVTLFEKAGAKVGLLNNLELYPDALTAMDMHLLRERVLSLVNHQPVEAMECTSLSMLFLASHWAAGLGSKVLLSVIHPDSLSDVPDAVFAALEERGALFSMNASSLQPTEQRVGRKLHGAAILPVPVDMPHLEFAPSTVNAAAPRLLTVARLVHDKRYVLGLLQTVATLRVRYPGIHLDIVGDGPLRPQVEGKIQELGLRDHVTLAGTVQPDQLRPFYERCDVYIGMGITALLAAGHSRPGIITFLDTQEPLTPGGFPLADPYALGERILGGHEENWDSLLVRLLEDAAFREAEARRGWTCVRDNFAEDAVMQRWMHIVETASAKPFAVPPPLWFDPPSDAKLMARRFLYLHPELYEAQREARSRLRAAVGLRAFRPLPGGG